MAITDVRIKEVNDNTKVVGKVSVTFDSAFVVHGFSIVKGKNGLFVTMPSIKTRDGNYVDIAHPITSDGRTKIIKKILDEYNITDTESTPFE